MSKQSEALRAYFDKYGIPRKDVCEKTGCASGTMSNILNGRFGISKKMAHALAKVYGFDVTFLLSGEGELFAPAGIRIAPHHNTNTGDGAGAINVNADAALRQQVADLQRELERERAEKARLLGIIETMTGK